MLKTIASALVTLLLVGSAQASVIVVDPNGSGNFTDLQPAIDSAVANDVIHIKGGTYGSIVISKPLTLVGSPVATIEPSPHPLFPIQEDAISLAGSGSGTVTLVNINTGGTTNGFFLAQSGRAIAGNGFEKLVIINSDIIAPQWVAVTGSAQGRAAIEVTIPFVAIEESSIVGQDSTTDVCYGFALDGGKGIKTNGTVLLLDSTVEGGDGMPLCTSGLVGPNVPPTASACPCSNEGGKGGDGLTANSLFSANSVVAGGIGTDVYYFDSQGIKQSWGKQPDGATEVVANKVALNDSNLLGSGLLTPGQQWSLNWGSGTAPSTLFVSPAVALPAFSSAGWIFFSPTQVAPLSVPAGPQTLPYTPATGTFTPGSTLLLQLHDPTNGMSRPYVTATLP